MAAILLPRPASARPPSLPILNRDTPLIRGLQHLWPLTAQSRLQNLVTRTHLTINPTSAYQWGAHPVLGSCLYLPSGASTASMLISGLASIAAPWTFSFWWHRIDGGSSVHVITSQPGSTIGFRGEQYNNTNDLGYSHGGSDFASGIEADTTRAQQITITSYVSANLDLYVDGVLRATFGSTNCTLALSRLFNYADAVSLPIYGWMGHPSVWTRSLTAHEAYRLYQPESRWDLYWQPSNIAYFLPAVAGGVSAFPDHYYRMMRSRL